MIRYRHADVIPDNVRVAKQVCILAAVSMVLFGFLLDTPYEIVSGLCAYVLCPDILITDYFVVGSVGAAFVNAGLVMGISILLTFLVKTPYNGGTISMLFLMAGFSLFGKNPVNVLPFFAGVWVYCKIHKQPMARYTSAAIYSSALAPFVSDVMLKGPLPLPVRLVLALLVGALIGYIIIPIAEHTFSAHLGYTLFNYGFAGGLIALIIASVLRALGMDLAVHTYWHRGVDIRVLLYLLSIIALLIVSGLWMCGWKLLPYRRIMRHSGRSPTDFVITDGIGATLVNMGVVGLMSIGYILLIGGDLNGPVVGAILTSIGFASAGEHPKNTLPIMLGVFIASQVMAPMSSVDLGMQLAALFGTALAPISGQFGWYYGIVAGFLHSALVLAVGEPCGGYNLYNNGFSAGLVAQLMIALIRGLSPKWRASDR